MLPTTALPNALPNASGLTQIRTRTRTRPRANAHEGFRVRAVVKWPPISLQVLPIRGFRPHAGKRCTWPQQLKKAAPRVFHA